MTSHDDLLIPEYSRILAEPTTSISKIAAVFSYPIERFPGSVYARPRWADWREPASAIINSEELRQHGNKIYDDNLDVHTLISIVDVDNRFNSLGYVRLTALTVPNTGSAQPRPV